MRIAIHAISLGLAASLIACAGGEKKKENGNKDGAAAGGDQYQNNSDPGVNNISTNSEGEVVQNAYTGYDGGKTNFSLIFPGYRTYTALDDTVKVEMVTSKLSDAMINEMIEARKKVDANFDVERFRKRFSREQTSYKVTPLKAGVARIKVERKSGGGGGGSGGGGNGPKQNQNNNNECKKPQHAGGGTFSGAFERQRGVNVINLTITEYSATAVEAGKQRYNAQGTASLKACASCHLSHQEGAPSHQLGRIMDISDEQAMSWVTKGKLGNRSAKIAHSWAFSSPEQEKGIVPYLRSVSTSDASELAKLYFEQALLEEQACEDSKNGTGTGTSTN